MGQRLVITVRKNEKDIAKIYYHWSAYSISALYEAKKVIDILYDDENIEEDLRLRLIRFCGNNGGGIDGGEGSGEWNYINKLYPNEKFKKDNISRNNGLIAISEEGMEEIQDWSEGDICIDLDRDIVINNVLYCEDINSYNDEHSEWEEDYEELTLEDIPDIEVNIEKFSTFDIEDIIDELERVNGYVCRNGEDIYELIA